MPITAFSREAAGEVDLFQWLALNGYSLGDDPNLERLPSELRAKAAIDIQCSGCQASGAKLVAMGRGRGKGRNVSQGHFRFVSDDGSNPHDPLCDFYDEKVSRDTEYLVNFASDRSAMTAAVRDLVCRGIRHRIFGQADIRQMRLWFLEEKAAHAVPLDVSAELLTWCIDMDTARWIEALPFRPEHGQLPSFDWARAARSEWHRRNADLFDGQSRWFHFNAHSVKRALRLIELQGEATVLDPTTLRLKYDAVIQLSVFAAASVYRIAGKRPASPHASDMGAAGKSLLALSALLLFKHDWDLGRAGAAYAILAGLPSALDGTEGNVMGLNPFHDFQAWQILHQARHIASQRRDARPLPEQFAEIVAELQASHAGWVVAQGAQLKELK